MGNREIQVMFYKHIKIRKQAQRCLGRKLNKAEKMLEGCLYPNLNSICFAMASQKKQSSYTTK